MRGPGSRQRGGRHFVAIKKERKIIIKVKQYEDKTF
jgi:hypothetical protein